MDVILVLKLNPSGYIILITLTLLMKIVWRFVWSEFSSVGREEWCDEMKDGQYLKLGDAHVTPRYIQEVQSSKLGDAQGIPFFINKNTRSFLKTLYFYCFIYYVLFLERQFFFLVLFCFVFCSIWLDPSIFVLERDTLHFHCLEHSSFHSYCSAIVHVLLVLRLDLVFHSYFVQNSLVFFGYIWLALWPLLSIIYESCFKQVDWCWRRVKYFMLIVVQLEACLDCGLDFSMSCWILF